MMDQLNRMCPNPECDGRVAEESNPPYYWTTCNKCRYEGPKSEGSPYDAVRLHNLIIANMKPKRPTGQRRKRA